MTREQSTESGRGESHETDAIPLRVAVLGGGAMARHHVAAVGRVSRDAEVAAYADPDPSARSGMASLCPKAQSFSSLESLLASSSPDVVHVCTPPPTHVALAMTALEAGCHVYIEKPFAERRSEADSVLRLAASKQLKVCAGHQLLFEKPSREIERLLPVLGQITHVASFFAFRPARRAGGRSLLNGDDQLLDILPHPAYLLLHFMERVAPEGETRVAGLELGPGGTVQALLTRDAITGTLTVTLEGRPVASTLRVVGTNGAVLGDYVRTTALRSLGPGSSGIDKVLAPYAEARQLMLGTTASLIGRIVSRRRSYPGLVEILDAFYASLSAAHHLAPVTPSNILETVDLCERVAEELEHGRPSPSVRMVQPTRLEEGEDGGTATDRPLASARPTVLVTGGTGWLGAEVARQLCASGAKVRVVARRRPASWDILPDVEYTQRDLAQSLSPEVFAGVDVVIHCAAATAGGWDEHQKHSLDATEAVIRFAARAGVPRLIHVSSMAVLENTGEAIDESTPLAADSKSAGPYAWGKLESERIARSVASAEGIELRVVRPGAIVDSRQLDPPGRLGKRVGRLFVAVGSPRDTLGVVELSFAGQALAWMAFHFDESPETLNLNDPELPTKRELVAKLKSQNPDLIAIWLPMWLLHPMSWLAIALQKVLRPGQKPINAAEVFQRRRHDMTAVRSLLKLMRRDGIGSVEQNQVEQVTAGSGQD